MSNSDSAAPEPLDDRAKSVLKTVFVTLFLDLVGFSIIFPLFPAMLDYYVKKEGDTGLLGAFISLLERFNTAAGGSSDTGVIVLFGGVLASLYSVLQFLFSPVIGSLSDRYGRKPLLLLSIAGIAVSYVLWFFSGAFIVLVIARIIGGMMAGNISTASAVVADVTSVRNRPRGMAIIGMAFGLGFILGPAIGGFSAMIDLTEHFPALVEYGLNPFSMPALIAFALSFINLLYVALVFRETLPESTGDADRVQRTINPLALFQTAEYPGVARTSLINFFFLTAFSGAEFGLTFLAAERLGYGPRQNAYLFLFIGIILALVQGGYVRRRGPVIGPKRMALQGFVVLIPGVLLLAIARSAPLIYVALFLMAVGSAQIIPCLSSLASAYAPAHVQGRVLGVFRSLGALARGVGPLVACVLYWRLGAAVAYILLAAAVGLPFMIAVTLPPVPSSARAAE
jgi:MFS family permease